MSPSANVILRVLPLTTQSSCRQTFVQTPPLTFQYCGGAGTADGKIRSTSAAPPAAASPIDHLKNPYGNVTPGGLPG